MGSIMSHSRMVYSSVAIQTSSQLTFRLRSGNICILRLEIHIKVYKI